MSSVSKNLMYRYSFKCLTENKIYETWDLPTNTPIACPVNDGHVIDSNNVEVINKAQDTYLDIAQIRTCEQSEENATQEFFRVEHYNFQCPSNCTTTFPVSFNYPVVVLAVKLITKEINDGDILNNFGTLNSPIGYITSNLDIGSSTIQVNNTAIQYASRGIEMWISGGSNTECLGEALKIYTDKIITVNPAVNSYLASTPTYVKIRSRNINNVILHKEVPLLVLGDSKIGGSILKPGINISVEYTNLSLDTNKDFSFLLEYMY